MGSSSPGPSPTVLTVHAVLGTKGPLHSGEGAGLPQLLAMGLLAPDGNRAGGLCLGLCPRTSGHNVTVRVMRVDRPLPFDIPRAVASQIPVSRRLIPGCETISFRFPSASDSDALKHRRGA